jgi:hypothetical protein
MPSHLVSFLSSFLRYGVRSSTRWMVQPLLSHSQSRFHSSRTGSGMNVLRIVIVSSLVLGKTVPEEL